MRWSSVIPILLTIQLVNCDPLDKTENDQRINSCGKMMQSKVYKGRDAQQSEAPWSVFFLIADAENGKRTGSSTICTGTLISPRHIIFATHCIAELQLDASWKIMDHKADNSNCKDNDYIITDESVLDRISIQSNGVTVSEWPEKVTVINGCIKRTANKTKSFNNVGPSYYTDDIAIIDLYEDLKFSSSLQTVCLAKDSSANKESTILDYFGFGLNPPADKDTSDRTIDDNSGKLRHETIQVQAKEYEEYNFLAWNEKKVTVTCVGDSGGGAIGTIDGKKTIVGVLSQTNCADHTKRGEPVELYTSVGYYNERICKLTGICDTDQEYTKNHPNYVKQAKPPRPTKPPVQQNSDGGVQSQRPIGQPDGANEKSVTKTTNEESNKSNEEIQEQSVVAEESNGMIKVGFFVNTLMIFLIRFIQ